ncbi:unnamed protein product, partial [Mesorhabditis spiculigera]
MATRQTNGCRSSLAGSHTCYLLPQLCHRTGITDKMRNDMLCMRAMSKVTRLTPGARLDMTRKWLRKVREMKDLPEFFRHCGFELDEEFIHFPSRRLDEELCFGRRPGGYKGEKAEWARQVNSNGNYRSAAVNHWMVVAPNIQQSITAAQTESIGRQINTDQADGYLDVIRENLDEAGRRRMKRRVRLLIGRPLDGGASSSAPLMARVPKLLPVRWPPSAAKPMPAMVRLLHGERDQRCSINVDAIQDAASNNKVVFKLGHFYNKRAATVLVSTKQRTKLS